MDGSDNLPLKIPLAALSEHLSCTICLGELNSSTVTPCGHRFCRDCIAEFVDRRRRCPICNQAVKSDQLIRDHQIDDLLATIKKEKEEAEKTYFHSLIESAASNAFGQETADQALSPIEEVLRKHLKASLAAHQRYLQDMRQLCRRGQEQLQQDAARRTADIKSKAGELSTEDLTKRLAAVVEECECRQRSLQDKLEETTIVVAEAFDRYLCEHLPAPSVIPVNVTLSVPSRNFTARQVQLAPTDNLSSIEQKFRQLLEEAGHAVVEFGSDCKFLLIGPFNKAEPSSPAKAEAAENGGISGSPPAGSVIVLSEDCHPLLQYGVKPGSEIMLIGKVVMESDLPKKCFVTTFVKGQEATVDYYTCKDCGFNWICQSCCQSCHKDHETIPYILNHKPTWACCYCPKRKKCTLQL